MTEEIRLEGLGLAPGVLDMIVTLAAKDVEGVACVCSPGLAGFVSKGKNQATKPVEVVVAEDGTVSVAIHIEAVYGTPLRAVAAGVQLAISDAIRSQVGTEISAVDVFVDGIVFSE